MTVALCVIVSDGRVMRTLHPPAFGADRAALEAIVRRALDVPGAGNTAPAASAVPAIPPARPAAADPIAKSTMVQSEIAREQGFSGDACTTCGNFTMKRAGHCLVCAACGTTTGCS